MSEKTLVQTSNPTREGRLAGRSVLLTGAAGSLGSVTSRRLLAEGARLVVTGRDAGRLHSFVERLAREGFEAGAIQPVTADSADPEACRRAVETALDRFGRLDVVVNNAGSAGARQRLEDIPFTDSDLAARGESETMLASAMNLVGGPWNVARAAASHLAPGSSIVNVSTIFSRTPYFGRVPYVVPKSALNALSLGLARELGPSRGVRVNTVFPGPIESERIERVFADMDRLRAASPGTTSEELLDLMILRRSDQGAPPVFRYPKPADVASAIVWLASDESAAFTGHAFEITHGMQVPAQSRAKLVSWPDMRLVDLDGRVVLILGGEPIEESVAFAEAHLRYDARVVLAFREIETLERARRLVIDRGSRPLHLLHLDPLRTDSIVRALAFVEDHYGRLDATLVLPPRPNPTLGPSLVGLSDDEVEAFVRQEIVAPVQLASTLASVTGRWRALERAPAVTFVTRPHDGHENRLNELGRAAVEELVRVWRFEAEQERDEGLLEGRFLPNQLVRFDNFEEDNLAFAADWCVTLANRVRRMDPINLWIPKRIRRATGKSQMPLAIERVLMGLHRGRTVVITGGSAGIGYQLGRFLAIAGARVLLAARSAERLEEARRRIVAELATLGYPEPAARVVVVAGIDVGDPEAPERLVTEALARFGHVDILINNAGVAGAEEMVVDMEPAAWQRTLDANLTSNYALIRRVAPLMKARGRGKILNVSSYFGGEKYVSVAYPNRADYAVSKAGQRALAEILSRHLGPEIQINALAPGPVWGGRLQGSSGRPGLFERRGRLILGNKRLNQVHAAVLDAVREGAPAGRVVHDLARNRIQDLLLLPELAEPCRRLAQRLAARDPEATSSRYLLNLALARKLAARLRGGGRLAQAEAEAFLEAFVDAPEPFFPPAAVEEEKRKVEAGILDMLHLHRMPTDEDVALSTTFHLADDNVSGETFHPSGGLKFDRSVTEGELIGRPGAEALADLSGARCVLLGETLIDEMAALVRRWADLGVAAVRVLTRTPQAAEDLKHRLAGVAAGVLDARWVGDDLEGGLEAAIADLGGLDVVVSTPFARLPFKPLAAPAGESWERVLTAEDLRSVCSYQLTHHFRVARKAALQDGCRIVLVTPDTSRASSREEFALALFVKTSLHAFTVTLGVETERIPTTPTVNQVQLTRRARVEEPRNDQEAAEELGRFVDAVLQCSLRAPGPRESRYLSRIYRGNAVTV